MKEKDLFDVIVDNYIRHCQLVATQIPCHRELGLQLGEDQGIKLLQVPVDLFIRVWLQSMHLGLYNNFH